jgi:phospho-N-acetylmuramoyl-pentapeptide-transferase
LDISIPLIIALCLGLLLGKRFIPFAARMIQPIRTYGPAAHVTKTNVPNLGGIIIFLPFYIVWLLLGNVKDYWFLLLAVLCYNGLGFVDDYLKSKRRKADGVTANGKLATQFVVAIAFVFCAQKAGFAVQSILVPCYGYVDLGLLGSALAVLAIVGTANATNLTDGLDGLVSVPLMTNAFFLLLAPVVAQQGMDIIVAAFVGGVLAFLWYNAHPAKIFMGDCGSMGGGCLIGCLSVLLGLELVLVISALVLVLSALSVIVQMASFKLRSGKRVFLMAPLHHHFEQLGQPETRIVTRMWILSFACLIVALDVVRRSQG